MVSLVVPVSINVCVDGKNFTGRLNKYGEIFLVLLKQCPCLLKLGSMSVTVAPVSWSRGEGRRTPQPSFL